MSVLDRFRKPGGFRQLVELLETCNFQKKEYLMSLIAGESPFLVGELESKILTSNLILSWDPDYLAEIAPFIPEKHLAVLLKNESEETVKNFIQTLSHKSQKNISVHMAELNPKSGEIESVKIKLIQIVRDLVKKKILHLRDIDPELEIQDELKVA